MDSRPNILVIVTDQEYAHQALPAGVALRNRDRIRSRGVTFNHHQATTTVCTPSRSVMWTGQHTPFTRMFDNTNFAWIEDMRADAATLPTIGHMLRELGYYTAYKGKWHESEFAEGNTKDAMEPFGFADFQEWGDAYGAPLDGFTKDPQTAADAAGWLANRAPEIAQSQPWYLAVNFINPHDIMYFDTDAEEMVQVRGMFPIFDAPDTPLYEQRWPTTLPASFFDDLSGQPPAVRNYKLSCDKGYGEIPLERRDMWHNHVNYYINCMIDVDRHIGTVLDALEASGQAANTIIIFTSDHGEMAGAHHLRQKGSVAFKETLNVPLTIVAPHHSGGVRTDAVGSHLDLVPTTLAFAGMSEQERKQRYPFLKGHDLSGVVAQPASDGPRGSATAPGRGALYTYDMIATIDGEWLVRNAPMIMDAAAEAANLEFRRGTEEFLAIVQEIGTPDPEKRELFRGLFDGRYKLVRYFGLSHYNLPQTVTELLANNDVALYDTHLDPEEMNNLADPSNPAYDEALLAAMNAKLTALIETEIGEDRSLVALSS
ncbi:MAG TPA: sulfatase-like hydrolase/transferase [Caldilinea sp.]|nr:sulfatase-like hydrolase/transferase [Caldilinea sp.]